MHHYSASTGGFYHTDLHGEAIPADAVAVSEQAHASLMIAQGRGAEIVAGPDGAPFARMPWQDRETLVGLAMRRIKSEARRRILAVATLERQANDSAALALGPNDPEFAQALARRLKINAIRAASNVLEGDASDLDPAALRVFNPAHSTRWPKA